MSANYIPLRAPEQARVCRIPPCAAAGWYPAEAPLLSICRPVTSLFPEHKAVRVTSTHDLPGGRPTMIPNAHRMFNFDLGETADAIRETVHDFSSHEIAPRADRDRQEQSVSARSLAEDRRARPARHHRRGGIWRLGTRLSRALHRGRGNFARFGGGRPVLRRAFQPLRQPDPPQRQRGAEAKISAEADFRRACRRRWRCRSPAPAPTWCR